MDIGEYREAVFLERPNRFLAVVELEGDTVQAHVPDPGRLSELFIPGARVRLRAASGAKRRTAWDLIGVECPSGWVNVDSRLPNLLFAAALREGRLEEFPGIRNVRPEYRYENSVLDFQLQGDGPACLVEVKGCTLVVDGVALFPDAPTSRGARHVADLMKARDEGLRACVVMVVKYPDAALFSPNEAADPLFASTLRRAAAAGVEVIAYLAPWRGHSIALEKRVDVRL